MKSPEERANLLVFAPGGKGITTLPLHTIVAVIAQAIRGAVAEERERCAQIADEIAAEPPSVPAGRHHDWQMGWQDGAMNAASAIRSLPTSGGE